ncbi:MAG: carbohydrate-binding domain-containing protein, partial [Muribaculaceae bacterium]|nr:carbohydrate-binding domain-containing protein [Muribaculaceae bacterium]
MKSLLAILFAGAAVTAAGSDYIWFHQAQNRLGLDPEFADSISLSADGTEILVTTVGGAVTTLERFATDSLTIGLAPTSPEVVIEYSAEGAQVVNPLAFRGVSVEVNGAYVTVRSTAADEVVYRLTGATDCGGFKIYSDLKIELLLDNVVITNPTGPAINVQTGKKTTLRLPDGTESSLTDGKTYAAAADGEDQKGTLFSEGQIEFRGHGTLNINGLNKHAICSDDYVELRNATVNVLCAASDGIHVNDYFLMESGVLTVRSIGGDGIDADKTGYITIQDGIVDVEVSGDGKKGLKTGTAGALTLLGGSVNVTATGNVVVESGDPSYCTALKSSGRFVMSGGSLTVKASGKAGKGIKSDGNATITGGVIDIEVTGAGGTYTNASSATDSYSSTCISVDSLLSLTGGTVTLSTGSAATGGKCIKADGDAVIGDEADNLILTATTRGARFSVGSSSGGNGGWGGGPGGWGGGPGGGGPGGQGGNYSNPKVIKAEGNLTVNGGHLTLSATNGEGGEGLESKKTLTINGGYIQVQTVDDCINAASHISITGGNLYCSASNNDAIDSNGTLAISGGNIVALATTAPECGLDCDANSRLTITGGNIVAIGGDNNTPSGSGTTQRAATYQVRPSTTAAYTFTTADVTLMFSFLCPRTYSS